MGSSQKTIATSEAFLHKVLATQTEKGALRELRVNSLYDFTPFYSQRTLFSHYESYILRDKDTAGSQKIFNTLSYSVGLFFIFIASLLGILVLLFTQRKVLLYATAPFRGKADFRASHIYTSLKEEKVSFGEILHCVPKARVILEHFRHFKFGVIYTEGFDLIYLLLKKIGVVDFSLKIISSEEDPLLTHFTRQYIRMYELSEWRTMVFRKIFNLLTVRSIYSVDYTAHFMDVLLPAKLSSIRTVAFQHGHYTKYHKGWLGGGDNVPRPHTLYVWSEYWKNELLRLGTYFKEEEIFISGYKEKIPALVERSNSLRVLVPYETGGDKKILQESIETFLSCGAEVYIKLRPDVIKEIQLEAYGIKQHKEIRSVYTLSEIKGGVSVVVGMYSTYLYDSALLGIPVAVLDIENDFGEGLVRNAIATKLPQDRTLMCQELKKIQEIQEEKTKEIRRRLGGDIGKVVGDVFRSEIRSIK